MIRRLVCGIFGHKPLQVILLPRGVIQEVKDRSGQVLVELIPCARCHTVYWRYPAPRDSARDPGSR